MGSAAPDIGCLKNLAFEVHGLKPVLRELLGRA
jgi:hypothetical protein